MQTIQVETSLKLKLPSVHIKLVFRIITKQIKDVNNFKSEVKFGNKSICCLLVDTV